MKISLFKSVLLLTGISILLIVACNSTRLVSSWKSPNASIQTYNKILVIGLMGARDAELRSSVENKIVEAFNAKGISAESAYAQFGPKAFDNLNEKSTLEKIRDRGYEGAFTIVLLDKTREKNYNPGSVSYQPYGAYYSRFWGQFRTVYSRVYDPGYYTTSTNYVLEANFYNLKQDMLQYSAQTKSFDPANVQTLASELSETVFNDMMAKGIFTQ